MAGSSTSGRPSARSSRVLSGLAPNSNQSTTCCCYWQYDTRISPEYLVSVACQSRGLARALTEPARPARRSFSPRHNVRGWPARQAVAGGGYARCWSDRGGMMLTLRPAVSLFTTFVGEVAAMSAVSGAIERSAVRLRDRLTRAETYTRSKPWEFFRRLC